MTEKEDKTLHRFVRFWARMNGLEFYAKYPGATIANLSKEQHAEIEHGFNRVLFAARKHGFSLLAPNEGNH